MANHIQCRRHTKLPQELSDPSNPSTLELSLSLGGMTGLERRLLRMALSQHYTVAVDISLEGETMTVLFGKQSRTVLKA
jgi:hypothetical protein